MHPQAQKTPKKAEKSAAAATKPAVLDLSSPVSRFFGLDIERSGYQILL